MPTTALEKPKKKFTESFPIVGAPEGGLPRLPSKISTITLDALGDLIGRYSAWHEFAADQHLRALGDFMEIKDQYDYEISKLLEEAPSGMQITEKKAWAAAHNKVKDLAGKYTNLDIYTTLLKRKMDSFESSLSMLSRELTRRGINNM